jgi:hypothetical protein
MKLDTDLFPANMNMAMLGGKKVLVWPSQAKSTKGKKVIIGGEQTPRMIRPKRPKDGQWLKNEKSKPQQCPKATFDILMVKYKEGRVGISEHENWTIQIAKPDSPVSLSRASNSAAESSSTKRSKTPPQQNSEGRDCHQGDYHLTRYFPNGPLMAESWGPPSMMYLPWTGWYGLWAPPPMNFHLGWSGLVEGFDHRGYYVGDNCYGSVGH